VTHSNVVIPLPILLAPHLSYSGGLYEAELRRVQVVGDDDGGVTSTGFEKTLRNAIAFFTETRAKITGIDGHDFPAWLRMRPGCGRQRGSKSDERGHPDNTWTAASGSSGEFQLAESAPGSYAVEVSGRGPFQVFRANKIGVSADLPTTAGQAGGGIRAEVVIVHGEVADDYKPTAMAIVNLSSQRYRSCPFPDWS